MSKTILFADDDASIRLIISKYLSREGFDVRATDNPETLMKWAKSGLGDVVLSDVHMDGQEIFSFLPDLKSQRPDLPVIIISANTQIVTAMKSRHYEVFEYVPKPFDLHDMHSVIDRALQNELPTRKRPKQHASMVIGTSSVMQAVFKAISDYSAGSIPVYIWGGAGTGKNLVAKCLQQASPTAKHTAFVNFSTYADADDLLSDGRGGTVFVDRVMELTEEQQRLLLQVLERNEARAETDRFRIIATGSVSLQEARHASLVRADILSHLIGGQIFLPDLVHREEDIAGLANYFLAQFRKVKQQSLHPKALVRLSAHSWPGNVRELRAVMQTLALKYTDKVLNVEMVEQILLDSPQAPEEIKPFENITEACQQILLRAIDGQRLTTGRAPQDAQETTRETAWETAMSWIEKPLIEEALRLCNGNNSKAAKILGIHRNTLRTKIRQLW